MLFDHCIVKEKENIFLRNFRTREKRWFLRKLFIFLILSYYWFLLKRKSITFHFFCFNFNTRYFLYFVHYFIQKLSTFLSTQEFSFTILHKFCTVSNFTVRLGFNQYLYEFTEKNQLSSRNIAQYSVHKSIQWNCTDYCVFKGMSQMRSITILWWNTFWSTT